MILRPISGYSENLPIHPQAGAKAFYKAHLFFFHHLGHVFETHMLDRQPRLLGESMQRGFHAESPAVDVGEGFDHMPAHRPLPGEEGSEALGQIGRDPSFFKDSDAHLRSAAGHRLQQRAQ